MKNLIKISALMLFGCQSNIIADKDYKLALNYFEAKMTDHFPKTGSYKSISIETDTSSYYNTFGVIVTIKVSKDQFNKTFQEYKNCH